MVTTVDGFEQPEVEHKAKTAKFSERQYAVEKLLESLRTEEGDAAQSTSDSRFFKHASAEKMFYHVVSDLVTFALSVLLAYLVARGIKVTVFPWVPPITLERAGEFIPVLFGAPMVLMMIASRMKGHYSRFKGFWEELGEFLQIGFTMAMLSIAYLFFAKSDFSRLWIVTSWVFVFALVPLGRYLIKHYLIRKGRWFTPTIVIGSGQNARESALAIESNILMGFEVVALVEISALEKMATQVETVSVRDEIRCVDRKFKLMRLGGDLKARLRALGKPYVVLALDAEDYTVHGALLEELAACQNNMSIIPPLRGLPLMGTEIYPIFRHEVMHLRIRNNLSNRIPRFIKRGFDMICSGLGLFFLSPLFIYLIIKVGQDGGPAFYHQMRIGRNGKIFKCWKFRSMHVNAEKMLRDLLRNSATARKEYEQTQKLKDDPRVTKLGEVIRATSLDELPQLWNVLKGDMSLVGPRPVRPDELSLYGVQSRYYLETRPGITGLWQISGRNDVDYHTRVNLDAWYVRNWSLWYDITILLKTARVVSNSNGAY